MRYGSELARWHTSKGRTLLAGPASWRYMPLIPIIASIKVLSFRNRRELPYIFLRQCCKFNGLIGKFFNPKLRYVFEKVIGWKI